jgi:hypothetical protein
MSNAAQMPKKTRTYTAEQKKRYAVKAKDKMAALTEDELDERIRKQSDPYAISQADNDKRKSQEKIQAKAEYDEG